MEPAISDELWAQIRKDFGIHFVRHKEYKKAIENFETSLSLQPEKLDSLHQLVKGKTHEGKDDEALNLLNKYSALESYKQHFKCNLHECDCYYEKNTFEKNLLILNDKKSEQAVVYTEIPHCGSLTLQKLYDARYKGPKLSLLTSRFEMARTGYETMLGKNTANFLLKQQRNFHKILDKWLPPEEHIDSRPLVLRGDDPCGFFRHQVKVVIPKTVKEQYRYKSMQRYFAQSYLHSAWKDYVLINDLKENKILEESKQNSDSFKNIHNAIDECIDKSSKVISQLHARYPLFTKKHLGHFEKREKTVRFRMQYKIRRDVFNALDEIYKCFYEKKLEKLIRLAEYELGYRYRIYPSCLIPRKNEFIVDICDRIAKAHIHDLIKSSAMINSTDDTGDLDFVKKLLRIYWKSEDWDSAVPYVFGDQSTYRDPAEPNTSFLVFSRNISRLEKRLMQKPMLKIERCHLFHEIGRVNLKEQRLEEARKFGFGIVADAENVSYFWMFVGRLLLCRTDVMEKKFKKAAHGLEGVIELAQIFKNEKLNLVLEKALEIVNFCSEGA